MRKTKEQIAQEIFNLCMLLEVDSTINSDAQSEFLSKSLTMVLLAGQKPENAFIISKHLLNAGEEILVSEGELDVKKSLVDRSSRETSLN